ncbi:MAG: Gldg family protein [Lachnospiraceae bacterium]|nr:Gldg family protein [Lachnospiraceae bacterium]
MSRGDTEKKAGSLHNGKLKRSVLSAIIIAGILLVLILVNVLFGKINVRYTKFDLTPNQMFNISDQTKAILENLNKDVHIYWIVQSDKEDSTLALLLERYRSITDRVIVEKVDPDRNPTLLEKYTASPQNNSLVVFNDDRYRYLDGNAIYEYDYSEFYVDGTSVNIRFAGETVLTSAINFVDKGVTYHMYALSGHGETDLPESYVTAVTKENVEYGTLSLKDSEVPEDASLIFINMPLSDLTDEELQRLQTYLDHGGNLLLITRPPKGARLANLDTLMAGFSVKACDGTVFEDSDRYFTMDLQYMLTPVAVAHTITVPISSAELQPVFAVAQGLRFLGQIPENLSVVPLYTTSEYAFSKTDLSNVQGYVSKGTEDIAGPFYLAMAFEKETESEITRAVWISSQYFTDESINEMCSGANEELFLNSVDWLSGQDESVIAVRSKALSEDHLRIDSRTATVLGILIIGLIPIVYMGVGILIRIRRKRR